MLQNINIEEIKQYNASLKEQREKASSLKAQIDYTTKELEQLCKELSAELGMEVTKDNIEQIYNDEVNKINSTLQSGKAVLTKIANEGNAVANAPQTQPVAPTVPVTPIVQAQPVAPTAPVVPQAPVTPQAPTAPTAPVVNATMNNGAVAGSVFGNNTQPQQLPPLFKI